MRGIARSAEGRVASRSTCKRSLNGPLRGSWRALCEGDSDWMPAIQWDLQPRAASTWGHADEKPAGSESRRCCWPHMPGMAGVLSSFVGDEQNQGVGVILRHKKHVARNRSASKRMARAHAAAQRAAAGVHPLPS